MVAISLACPIAEIGATLGMLSTPARMHLMHPHGPASGQLHGWGAAPLELNSRS